MYGLLSVLRNGANLANDARIHNQTYFGTEKEIQRNNPRIVENVKSYIRNIQWIENIPMMSGIMW